MLFYHGYQPRIRQFLFDNSAYSRYVENNTAWTLPAIDAAKRRDLEILAAAGAIPAEDPDEIKKYYAFSQTGNVMVSSTAQKESEIDEDVKKVFRKSQVFMAALTAAVFKAKKNLYDYDAVEKVIGGSGLFVELHREDRTFSYSSTTIDLNTAIISAVLGGVTGAGGALIVAQKIIDNMGSQIRIAIEKKESTKKVAHLLFVCENLMGMPMVSISLFYIEAKEAEFTVEVTNCFKVANQKIDFKYHQDTFMFVDPEYISQFTEDFQENEEFKKIIDRLSKLIDGEAPLVRAA